MKRWLVLFFGFLAVVTEGFETGPQKANASVSPVLSYSSYLGGGSDDIGYAVATDTAGNVYVAGSTVSTNLPTTTGAFQTTHGGGTFDAFVMKMSPAGVPLYITYLGGSGDDEAFGIAVNAAGQAYVTGYTTSSNFPTTTGAYRTAAAGGRDIFVAVIDPTGSSLIYSTRAGGSSDDVAYAIAVDSGGSAYLTGYTTSANFPTTTGAFQRTLGGDFDAFVMKLNAAGTALVYATYLGGSGEDIGFSLALDSSSNAYVAGHTQSSNFPVTAGAYQGVTGGGYDAFVASVNPTGTALAYSTYLGGASDDYALGVAVDPSGNAYVTGYTSSANFPTTVGSYQTAKAGGYDAFVLKLNGAGTALAYSTFLGGTGDDYGLAVAVNAAGEAYVTGDSASGNFPVTSNALQALNGTYSAFLTKLSGSGNGLSYSTYLGGSGFETGYGIAVNSGGDAFITGYTVSTDFPTTLGAFRTSSAGAADAFVAVLSPPVCNYGVTPGSLFFQPGAGTGSVNVTVAAGCIWTASANAVWLTIASGANGNGNGTVNYSVAANASGTSRSATLTVAGQNLTVTQAGVFSYVVGDVFPMVSASGDLNGDGDTKDAGEFGDGTLTILDLIYALRAVTSVPGYRPPQCSDRFDAMDAFPKDTDTTRGGDGILNTVDLIYTLRRVTNVDTTRPVRASRGLACPTGLPELQPLSRRAGGIVQASLVFGKGEDAGGGATMRVPIFLESGGDLRLAGVSVAFGVAHGALRFVPAGGVQPAVTDDGVPGMVAVAWLGSLRVGAGERLLLGTLEMPSAAAGSLVVHGADAVAEDGRPVKLSTSGNARE